MRLRKIFRKRHWKKELSDASAYPPVIHTPFGPTSEPMRRQAAENMRLDPAVKARVENAIGMAEARRRYPEAYEEL